MFPNKIMYENLLATRLLEDDHGHVCIPDLKIATHKCTSFIKQRKLEILGTAEEEEFLHFIM